MKWKGRVLLLGEVQVGKVWLDGLVPQGSPDAWASVLNLPGEDRKRHYPDQSTAKQETMRRLLRWLDRAGIFIKEE